MQSLGLKMASLKLAMMPITQPNRRERVVAATSSSSFNSSSSSSERGRMESDAMLSSPTTSLLSKSQTYALLKKQMAVAAKSENYEEAARIRDSLKSFEEEEPVLRLRGLLKKAVEEERFKDAARYQNELNVLAPHMLLKCSSDATTVNYEEAARIRDSLKSFEEEEPVLRLRGLLRKAVEEERFKDAARYQNELNVLAPHMLLKCSSDATTVGIRVQVRSVYIESRSQPSKGLYFFAYRIRITNNSAGPVQLLRRHWIIMDGNGKTENFWGVGVIGEQPVILPNTGFEYSSACPLSTHTGRMEGDFEMRHIDVVGSSTFNVAIAPFSLSMGDETYGVI